MTSHQSPLTGLVLGLFLIGSAVTAGAAVITGLKDVPPRRDPGPVQRPAMMLAPPAEPIPAEADVFRTNATMTAIDPLGERQRTAIPRSLHRYRVLRAYPGAPPSIPHGFTGDEYRTGSCRTCHERGGYSPRFKAYVPLTPHPEMGACLQCHVGNDAITGVSLPNADPNTICRQCHPPNAPSQVLSTVNWSPMSWPQLHEKTPDGPPPPIVHDSQFRGNCLACHSGPGALESIRTSHPERANCRQCHVAPDARVGVFTRSEPDRGDGTGDAS